MTSLRAFALFCVVVMASFAPAFGSTIFISGTASTQSSDFHGGLFTTVWDEDNQASTSSNNLTVTSGNGPLSVSASAYGSPGLFQILASASVTASDHDRGPIALGTISFQMTDRLTPAFAGGADFITYVQHLSIEGSILGNASSSGHFETGAFVNVLHDGVSVAFAEEGLVSGVGYSGSIPRGDMSWEITVSRGTPLDFQIQLDAYALTFAIEADGAAICKSDFSNTFRWGDVTDVRNAITGEPIDAASFHLYDENGFDWAHPVPEPSSLMLVALGLLGGLRVRRRLRAS